MKRVPVLLACCLALLASCATFDNAENSLYQSNAPEIRGERAISSSIELVKEVNLGESVLGVFFSHEVFHSGSAENLLFTRRTDGGPSTKKTVSIVDYDLSEISSLSVEQARKFLDAIDTFLKTDPKSLSPMQMVNFELYSGTLDMSAGSDKYRPFKTITFIVVCSVTSAKKSFKTAFPGTVSDLMGNRITDYSDFSLTTEQVQDLRTAVAAALEKAVPVVPARHGKRRAGVNPRTGSPARAGQGSRARTYWKRSRISELT